MSTGMGTMVSRGVPFVLGRILPLHYCCGSEALRVQYRGVFAGVGTRSNACVVGTCFYPEGDVITQVLRSQEQVLS